MLKIQKSFQDKTGFNPSVQELASAIMAEGGELWAGAGGKWWKHYVDGLARGELTTKGANDGYLETLEKQEHAHLVEESIDVLHFLLCTWIRLGIPAEQVFDAYCAKMNINKERQDNKY